MPIIRSNTSESEAPCGPVAQQGADAGKGTSVAALPWSDLSTDGAACGNGPGVSGYSFTISVLLGGAAPVAPSEIEVDDSDFRRHLAESDAFRFWDAPDEDVYTDGDGSPLVP